MVVIDSGAEALVLRELYRKYYCKADVVLRPQLKANSKLLIS